MVILTVLLSVILFCASCGGGAKTQISGKPIGMPNPASVNCVNKGYKLEIRKAPDGGEYGVCITPQGKECEEWALFRGECQL